MHLENTTTNRYDYVYFKIVIILFIYFLRLIDFFVQFNI
jgi:hypothetical protein